MDIYRIIREQFSKMRVIKDTYDGALYFQLTYMINGNSKLYGYRYLTYVIIENSYEYHYMNELPIYNIPTSYELEALLEKVNEAFIHKDNSIIEFLPQQYEVILQDEEIQEALAHVFI